MPLRSKGKLTEVESDRNLRITDDPSKSLAPNYKGEVLKLLSKDKENQFNHLVFELRMALFVAAARSTHDKCHVPFPPCLLDDKSGSGVMSQIQGIPSLVSIQESTQLPEDTWVLLSWILKGTNAVILLEPLVKNMGFELIELRRETGLGNLPTPNNVNLFMFKVTQTQPKPEFEEAKRKYGSKFAYHGSAVKNFHSILHRGLMSSFSVTSGCSLGTYLTLQIHRAHTIAVPSPGWDHSVFGNTFRCVAVAEFALSPDTRDLTRHVDNIWEIILPWDICTCNNDDHIRVTHLYLYRH